MAFIVAARMSLAVVVVAVFTGAARFGEPGPNRESKCFNPTIHTCNASIYPILNYKVSAWFYHALFKSCRPLYSNPLHQCPANKNLPATREECERLCGVSCTSGDGRMGLCTFDEYCKSNPKRTLDHPKPCGAYGVICCPPRAAAPPAITAVPHRAPAASAPQPSISNGPTGSIAHNTVDDQERYRYRTAPSAPTLR